MNIRRFLCLLFALFAIIISSCSINDSKESASSGLFRILVGEKYGFIDAKGNIVIEPQYDDAFVTFSENLCFVMSGEKKYLIDRNGVVKLEVADSIVEVSNFIDGVALIRRREFLKYDMGVMDKNGNLIIPAIHYKVSFEPDGETKYICVESSYEEDWFMTDMSGNMIGSKCDSILSGFHNGLCAVKFNGKWGYMNPQGQMVIDTLFDFARVFSDEGIARVRKGKEEMYIDKSGKCVINVDKPISDFNHNRAIAIINGEKCLIDKYGNIVKQLDCESLYEVTDDGLMAIVKDGKVSIIDTLGNVIFNTQFSYIGKFDEGVAIVEKDEMFGAIDLSGKEIIHTNNEDIYPIGEHNDLIIFENDNGYGDVISYFDKKGNMVWQDIPTKKVYFPYHATREKCIEYFDANIASLDPIEGIYYVTKKNYYQDRYNLASIGLNETESRFVAVVCLNYEGAEFSVYVIDERGLVWNNKFVRLGNSSNYAIVKRDKNSYLSEGRMSLDDPNQFDFRLETGKNDWYNFFDTYEFVRDYPPVSEVEQYKRAEWTGTGFAFADGYIATNYHVTNGAKTIRVKGINGDIDKVYNAFVVTSDKKHDLSIIKIVDSDFAGFGQIPYQLGKAAVDVGDDVFVLGYPMTTSMGNEVKLTSGIISSATGYKGDDSMYQISAAVQPGNSGGPLFNADGNVIGIVCGKHADAENANYAIKVSYLYSLIDSYDMNISLANNSKLRSKKLSSKVNKVKDFVYLIECSSK